MPGAVVGRASTPNATRILRVGGPANIFLGEMFDLDWTFRGGSAIVS